jgi:hypothetical protein
MWSAAVSQTSRSAYFISNAWRACNVLRLVFATVALHRQRFSWCNRDGRSPDFGLKHNFLNGLNYFKSL